MECRPPKADCIKQVDWLPPPVCWPKCNTDGLARGNPSVADAGGIFRDSSGAVKGCFLAHLGVSTALHAEFVATIMAVEIAH